MIKNPIYQFDNETSTGLEFVPNGAIVLIENLNSELTQVYKIGHAGINAATTIAEFLAMTANWTDMCCTSIVDDLVTGGVDDALSAEQGVVLQDTKVGSITLPNGETRIADMVSILKADYDAIAVKDADKLYIVLGLDGAVEGVYLGDYIPPTLPAPKYLLSSPIIDDGSFYYVKDEYGNYNGTLLNDSGDTWTADEVAARYTDTPDGVIDLSGGYYIDTGWTPPTTEEWHMSAVYDYVNTSVYKMYTINYNGNGTADVYKTIQGADFDTTPNKSNVLYSPPIVTWKIYEIAPSIVTSATKIEYVMNSYTTR